MNGFQSFEQSGVCQFKSGKIAISALLCTERKPLNMKDAMPFLLSNMRQAKENHIDFTKPEIELLCDLLSKDLPPESQTQMKKIMSLMSMNRSHPAP